MLSQTEEEFLNKIKETISENYKRETDHFLDHHIEDYFICNTPRSISRTDFLKTWLKTSSKGQVTDEVLDNEFRRTTSGA